jgi:cytochrome c3-like protein
MRNIYWVTAVLVGLALVLGVLFENASPVRSAVAAPPLSIEHLLGEKLPEASKDEDEILADNGSCYVCHGNYEEEPFALLHAKEDVGCADCHGESHDHRNDEDNITPPEKMYAAADIGPACAKCHETHDAPAVKVIARWRERCPAKTDAEKLVCTDCHGRHRLKFRTVWWDKKTGELVVRKEGQRTKAAKDLTTVPAKGTQGSAQ